MGATGSGRMSEKTGARQSAFSLQVMLGLVVVGIVSFAAFIVLSAFADDLRSPKESGEHAQSKSAVGFAGLVQLLQQDGRTVRMTRGPISQGGQINELAVMTPPLDGVVSWEKIYDAPSDVLIILPKWRTSPDPDNPQWVRLNGLAPASRIEETLEQIDESVKVVRFAGVKNVPLEIGDRPGSSLQSGPIESLQVIESDSILPIMLDVEGRAVLGRVDLSEEEDVGYNIFILAEPDLLNTQGIASLTTARVGMRVFEIVAPDKAGVAFDMTMHGLERSRNFLRLMFVPPFLPAILCLAFAAGLMAVNAVAGNVKMKQGREIALGKTMLVENSALLVSLAGRDRHMGKRYVAMTRQLAATAAGAPHASTEKQQTAMLDAVALNMKNEASFSQMARDATEASTPSALLRATNRLYRWRQEIGREHRRR
jgi:hypothetical protein